ncbi:hypothetical protein F5Y19DRAFT_414546 [Xylariaceae sp. FL1651]|nr:hypothetical protein F5Y19DRAFT_414546 [Xylariaceae sp. FL1651]
MLPTPIFQIIDTQLLMAFLSPEDVLALVISFASLLVEILSLLLAYRTFLNTQYHRRRDEHPS